MLDGLWNEVIVAYDSHFLDLEVARNEYGKASKQLFENLTGTLLAITPDASAQVKTRLEVRLQSSEFGKDVLVCGCLIDEVEWTRVEIRLAAPWGGQPGKLYAVIVLQLNESWLPWPEGVLSDFVKRNQWEAGETGLNVGQFPQFIEGRYLSLTEKPESHLEISGEISYLIQTSVKIAASLDREAKPVRKGEQALLLCRDLIEQEPTIHKYKLDPETRKTARWKGLIFIQVNIDKSIFRIWLTVNPKSREIMYGHSDFTDKVNVEFASRLKCRPGSFGGHPSGVLMSTEKIENTDTNQIADELFNVYREFLKLVK